MDNPAWKSSHPDLEMKTVACDFCGADDPSPLFSTPDFWLGVGGEFTMQRCGRCDHIYQNPRPAAGEIGRLYPDEYAPFASGLTAPNKRQRWMSRYFINKQVRLARRFIRPGQAVLEIGCASGDFLAALREEGVSVTGIEPGQAAARTARKRHGLKIINKRFEETDLTAGSFDGVVMWNVWEHLAHPRAALERLTGSVRPGGVLIINIPNPAALEARLFGKFWAGWDLPRHFNIYNAQNVRSLLAEYGWRTVEMRGFGGRLWLLRLSMSHLVRYRSKNPWWVRLASRLVQTRWIAVVSTPVFMALELLNASSIMVIVACLDNQPAGQDEIIK